MGEESKAQSSFPPPPTCYFKAFSDEAVANGTAPSPPAIPPSAYSCFGAPLEVNEEILRPLSTQGLEQLYSNDSTGTDRISEMRKLNFSIIVNFLDLLHILVHCPSNSLRETKINDISLLFINLHHMINEYRPHQARETIRVMMERQLKRRQSSIEELQGHLDKVQGILEQSRPLLSDIRAAGSARAAGQDSAPETATSSETSHAATAAAASDGANDDEVQADEPMDMDDGRNSSDSSALEPSTKRPCSGAVQSQGATQGLF